MAAKDVTLIEELEDAGRRAADAVGPAVVRVGRGGGRGAGVVVRPGVVVTNAHNVRGEEITVTFADGRVERGVVSGTDLDGDLAAVAVDTADVDPPSWAEADGEAAPAAGQVVFAVGSRPGGGVRLSQGIVSSTDRVFRGPRGRRVSGSLEHSAPLPKGGSGSAVVDARGHLLGINTHRVDGSFYLALPAGQGLARQIDRLAAGETPEPVTLGVALAPNDVAAALRSSVGLEPHDGVLVRGVADGSPAADAGIEEGDLLHSVGGAAIEDIDDVHDALAGLAAGDEVTIGLLRGAEEREVTVAFVPDEGGDGPS